MAWPTRSRVLAIKAQAPTVANTKYSAGGPAAGATWLVKSTRVYNGDAAARSVYVFLRRAGVDYPQVFQSAIPAGQVNVDPYMYVAEAGDTLWIASTVACANLIVTFHGALLG